MPRVIRILAKPAFKNRSVNPYNAILYGHVVALGVVVEDFSFCRMLAGRFDIVHLHWPEAEVNHPSFFVSFARCIAFSALIAWAKVLGKKVVWTVHNIEPHEVRHPLLQRVFRGFFLAMLDGYFSLTETALRLVQERYPVLRRKSAFLTPHGHYRGAYPRSQGRQTARLALGLPLQSRVFLFVGQIRPYKNVCALVRRFAEVLADDSVLIVAGTCTNPALCEEVKMAAEADRRVRLRFGFLPDEELSLHLDASDLVVLPFTEILNSGTALLALSFARPVLVPKKGSLLELERAISAPWVLTYDGELRGTHLEESMRRARAITPEDVRGLAERITEFDWPRIARKTVAAYEELLGKVPCDTAAREDSP